MPYFTVDACSRGCLCNSFHDRVRACSNGELLQGWHFFVRIYSTDLLV